jgi:hypothetical protein
VFPTGMVVVGSSQALVSWGINEQTKATYVLNASTRPVFQSHPSTIDDQRLHSTELIDEESNMWRNPALTLFTIYGMPYVHVAAEIRTGNE